MSFAIFVAMAESKLSMDEKKSYAKLLFTREQLEQKEIARKVKVSERTISNWVNDNGWKDLRRRLLITKEQELSNLYEQLENLNIDIRKTEKKYADTKQADILIKLTAAIRNLETDLGIAELVESGMKFIKFIQQVGTPEQLKEFADLWNSFIQSSIKKQ